MNNMDKSKLAGQALNRLEESNHGKIMLSIKNGQAGATSCKD